MSARQVKQHRACGGGVSYAGPAADGRPRFACSRCGETWTDGKDGGTWASLVPAEKQEPVYIVAGSHAQARDWMHRRGLDPKRLVYIWDRTRLLGHPPATLLVVGTALRDRRDLGELLDYAEAVGWKVERV